MTRTTFSTVTLGEIGNVLSAGRSPARDSTQNASYTSVAGLHRADVCPIDVAAPRVPYKRNVLLSGALFLAALVLVCYPGLIDIPAVKLLNSYANRNALLDTLFYAFDTYFTFSGVVLVALISACWFSDDRVETRARILVATLGSLGAGALSRFLQHHLPTHIRPYYDPGIGFHAPALLEKPFNTWNCFPSDHAAVFAGLAVTIYLVRPRWGLFAAAWLVLIESARVYMGAHYPSDLVGGAAFAAMVVWASQSPWIVSVGRRLMLWERSSRPIFYMLAFFTLYQIGTLFLDVRRAASDFSSIHLNS
jgi:membrane-associated phospholipid phosphatase